MPRRVPNPQTASNEQERKHQEAKPSHAATVAVVASEWVPVVAAVGGAGAGGLIAFSSAVMTNKHNRKVAAEAFDRARRVARADRLRAGYALVVNAALGLQTDAVAHETTLVQFDKELILQEIANSMGRLREAQGAILLEPGSDDVLDVLRAVETAHREYRLALAQGEPMAELLPKRQALRSAVDAVLEKARAHVESIEAGKVS